jgi:hypothetical protein
MVEYFVANMDQYGCGSKLKLTDPKTGKAANVVVIDRGPYCGVYHGHDMQINGAPMRIDISNAASNYLGSPDILKVEKLLDNNAPIGPLPECVADNGKKSITGAFGNLLDAYLYSKPMNNSALTFSSTNCPVSWEL